MVLPRSFQFKPRIKTQEALDIAFNFGLKYQERFIKNNHYRIITETNNIQTILNRLSRALHQELIDFIKDVSEQKLIVKISQGKIKS